MVPCLEKAMECEHVAGEVSHHCHLESPAALTHGERKLGDEGHGRCVLAGTGRAPQGSQTEKGPEDTRRWVKPKFHPGF